MNSVWTVDNKRDMYIKNFPAGMPDLTSHSGKMKCIEVWVIASTTALPLSKGGGKEEFLTMESQWVDDPLEDKILVFDSPQNAIEYAQAFREVKLETRDIPIKTSTIIDL